MFGEFIDNILYASRHRFVFYPFETDMWDLVGLYLLPDIVTQLVCQGSELFRECRLVGRRGYVDIRIGTVFSDLDLDDADDTELFTVFPDVFEDDRGGHREDGFCKTVGFRGHTKRIERL